MPEAIRENVGAGICDGCGQQKPELVAFNAPQVASGVCICTDCLHVPDDEMAGGFYGRIEGTEPSTDA